MPAFAVHIYVSTACMHAIHERCRLRCKYCAAPCRCPCHEVADEDSGAPLTHEG